LLLAAGRQGTPIPHTIPYDATLFAGLVGASRMHHATLTTPDGEAITLWLNGSANPHTLTRNEPATRLYQRLSTVPATILGDVIITAADGGDIPWSAVELVQGLHANFERNLTAALGSVTERGVG
jgi:hypothetical protein